MMQNRVIGFTIVRCIPQRCSDTGPLTLSLLGGLKQDGSWIAILDEEVANIRAESAYIIEP